MGKSFLVLPGQGSRWQPDPPAQAGRGGAWRKEKRDAAGRETLGESFHLMLPVVTGLVKSITKDALAVA
jgi:hypothetical protein